jgi:ABC-type Fe3+/spermidine/putrescine transport system ATPase subunit
MEQVLPHDRDSKGIAFMSETTVLDLKGIVKRYGSALAVGPVDISVRQGELLTLLGPSGCGKTTTLHIVAGLIAPTEGTVTMQGRDLTRVEPPQRDMGLVFQNYALFPHKTIFDNVAFGLRMRRVPREEIRKRVHDVLDVVGLPGVEKRYPHELSGGQRQRVAVARAVVIEPGILLLDEPLSNLDAVLRKRMRLELREIQQRLGITTIFVTHDQDEAFEMSDRVILMNKGKIEQVGTPEEMYDKPRSRFAAEFIGEVAAVGADGVTVTIGGKSFRAPAGERHLAAGDRVDVMIRPERIEISTNAPAEGSALDGRVVKRVFSGDMMALTLRTDDGLELTVRKPSSGRYRDIASGDRVWIVPEDCWLLEPRDRREAG